MAAIVSIIYPLVLTAIASPGHPMTMQFLIGAIIGSGVAIFFGRQPAEKLIAVVQQRYARRDRD